MSCAQQPIAWGCYFFFQAEDGIRDADVTGVQTCALPIYSTYGIEGADVSAPGGWFRDFFGSPQFRQVENEILSTAPKSVLEDAGVLDPNGVPLIPDVVRDCKGSVCAYRSEERRVGKECRS